MIQQGAAEPVGLRLLDRAYNCFSNGLKLWATTNRFRYSRFPSPDLSGLVPETAFSLQTTKRRIGVRKHWRRDRLSVSRCSLQGSAERPLPCNYNVIQPVSALSRRRRGFKSKRKMGSISQMSRRGLRPRGQGIPPVGKPVLSTFDDVNEIAATFSVRQ